MVEIIALLMFVGADQKLIEMTYMPSAKVCLEKREFLREIAMLRLCVLRLWQN